MTYLFVILLTLSFVLLLWLYSKDSADYFSSFKQSQVLSGKSQDSMSVRNLEEELMEQMPFLQNILGKHIVMKFFVPMLALFAFCMMFAGPQLTNPSLGLILGAMIALACSSRMFYHYADHFRHTLLVQLERILLSIRNNLSTGLTLDYAVATALKNNREEPLGPHLDRFINVTEVNFIENFPLWLHSIRNQFRLDDLSKSAQLLTLELEHNSNQEEAFVNAAESVADVITVNRRQSHTVWISFFTMDFMVLAFFGMLFLVIPMIDVGTGQTWWQHSATRPQTVFFSAMLIWGAYLLTVLIMLWRQR